MAGVNKSVRRVMAECKRLRASWNEAEHARRLRLGETRRRKLLDLLKSLEKRQAAA